MKKLFLVMWVLLLAVIQMNAQEIISNAGDEFVNGNQSIAWSLGEISTESYGGGGKNLTEGFHQPIFVITALENIISQHEMVVFPNPTAGSISFKSNSNNRVRSVIITNLIGVNVCNIDVCETSQSIDLSNIPDGEYILSVYGENENKIGIIKIIKGD
jgi:hypothetical protein